MDLVLNNRQWLICHKTKPIFYSEVKNIKQTIFPGHIFDEQINRTITTLIAMKLKTNNIEKKKAH